METTKTFHTQQNIYTLRELIFAGTNFRGYIFWTFRGNLFSRIREIHTFRGN